MRKWRTMSTILMVMTDSIVSAAAAAARDDIEDNGDNDDNEDDDADFAAYFGAEVGLEEVDEEEQDDCGKLTNTASAMQCIS